MSKTFSVAIPYIVLALVFAALVQLAGYGFVTSLESQTLAALDQLVKGADICAGDWGTAALYSMLLEPVYAAALALNGGLADGAAYLMRVLCTAVSFAVCLVAYKLISARSSSSSALCLCATWLVLASSRASVMGFGGLGADCLLVSVLLGWAAYADALQDDGSQTGYARILKPVFAGFFAVVALALSAWMGAVAVALLLMRAFSSSCDGKRTGVLIAWVAGGVALGLACVLIAALGYGEPGPIFGAVASWLGASLALADAHGVHLLLSVALIVASAVLCVVILEIDFTGRKRVRAGVLAAFAAVAVAACAVAVQPAMSSDSSKIEQGPAAGIVCGSAQYSRYEGALEIAGKAADGGSVLICGSTADSWVYPFFRGARSDEDASWILVFNEYAGQALDEGVLDNCGKIAGNDTCSLYRRATTIGAITQG